MRSYCVIPPSARDSPFFDAVYEDGVRAQHEGRLLPLPFTHVLSPAHDLMKHVNGPLLEAVRDGHNAMLLVALPAAADTTAPLPNQHARTVRGRGGGGREQEATSSADISSITGTQRQNPSAPLTSSPSTTGLQDCTEVARELYASLLPLLFQNAAACTHAAVSVVTASAQDRTLIDELQPDPTVASGVDGEEKEERGRRVRSLKEVVWRRVEREGSAAAWGSILHRIHSRHAALTGAGSAASEDSGEGGGAEDEARVAAAASFAAQTACVVTVQLEDGYGRVVLVDAGSDQDLLQALTLILGIAGVAGARPSTSSSTPAAAAAAPQRTYPARTPLLTLLQENVAAPAATCAVHVVAVPHPACAARDSLRIMRFASDAAASRDAGTKTPTALAQPPPWTKRPTQTRPPRAATASDRSNASNGSGPPQASAGPSPIPSRTPIATAGSSAASLLFRHHTSGDAQPQLATPAPLPPAPHVAGQAAQPPPPWPQPQAVTSHADPQATSREQHLMARIAFLEAQLRELTQHHTAVQAARAHVEQQVNTLKASLREKQEAWLLSQERNATMEKENAEFAALVPKLLKKVAGLEKKRDELAAAQAAAIKAQQAAEATVAAKDDMIATLQKKVATLERRETQRLRQATLGRIPVSENDKASADPTGHTSRQDRVAELTLQELRRRNRDLEHALGEAEARAQRRERELAARKASPPSAAAAAPCASCDALQERLAYFMKALSDTRKEKDQLVQAVVAKDELHTLQRQTHNGQKEFATTDSNGTTAAGAASPVATVVSSLLAGCASLHAQLLAIQESVSTAGPNAVPSRPRGSVAGVDPTTVAEHLRAVDALATSLQEIGSRRCRAGDAAAAGLNRGSEGTAMMGVPRMATAADVAAMTTLLTFETERAVHLRAFLPTFAQLAVAAEHLRMRLKRGTAR